MVLGIIAGMHRERDGLRRGDEAALAFTLLHSGD